MRHSVEVAEDMVKLLKYTPYIVQVGLGTQGTWVRLADARKKKLVAVNIDAHRTAQDSLLHDKWLVVKLTTRLIKNLITPRKA